MLAAPLVASASTFFVVTPLPGRATTVEEVPEISVVLASATLPPAKTHKAYSHSFGPHLSVTGDPEFEGSGVTFAPSGALPAGLVLSADGLLSGSPTTPEPAGASFQIQASYKDKTGQQVYTLIIGNSRLQATQIAAGKNHTCALTTDGAVKCWGKGFGGELGDGKGASSSTPVEVVGLPRVVSQISAGYNHTCAVFSGTAYCWGSPSFTPRSLVATPVAGLSGVTQIVASDITCAVAGGAAYCWGENYNGRLGNGSMSNSSATPVMVSGLSSGVTQISLGAGHACALVNGGVRCWGQNGMGQLGSGTIGTHRSTSQPVPGLVSGVTKLVAGWEHTCAIASGVLKCWGSNSGRQLSLASGGYSLTPIEVSGLAGVLDVAAGEVHTCAIDQSRRVQCWGMNLQRQLGNGQTTPTVTAVPQAVVDLGQVTALSSYAHHTCALEDGGYMKCWGEAADDKLGSGTTIMYASRPLYVQAPAD